MARREASAPSSYFGWRSRYLHHYLPTSPEEGLSGTRRID